MARGTGIALSNDKVPEAYCDAVSSDESEGEELAFQTNAARQQQRVLAKYGAGRR